MPPLFYVFALLTAWVVSPRAHALDMGDIIVTSIQGEVKFTLAGAPRSLKAGAVLKLPAIVTTGKDGSVELKQGATSIRVGPETELNFPAAETRGGPIDRIVQPKGNAFYDVGKREGRKLRVETPVLVGVVKGTQFNVAALEGSTTISLFEGRLEILDMNGGAIDLAAGEIASRKRGDAATSVLKMSSKVPVGAAPKNSSRVLAAGSEVSAESVRHSGLEPHDDVASNLLASDLALASNTGAPVGAVDPVTNTPEIPVAPPQPDVGTDVPDVGTTPPLVDVPDDVVTVPDLGEGGGVVAPPVVDIGGDDVTPPVLDTGNNIPADPPVTTPDPIPDLGTTPDPVLPDLDIDDGNNGHGNDDDRDDSSNPGRGNGRGR